MASAAEAIFARELLELRMTGGLLDAYDKWAAAAVNTVMRGQNPNVAGALMRGTVLSSIPDELRDTAARYLADNRILDDAVDVLHEVREFAGTHNLSKDATRALLRTAVRVDRGVFVPLPQEVLARTRVPQLVPALPREVPQHPALLAPDIPFAQTGVTYETRLERVGRTLSTTMSGRLARIEAELTGQDLRWITMGDHRVRDTHQAVQGMTVAYDEWFQVGGIPMEYPGDPAAPIDETINCRCVLALVTPPERRFVQRYIPRPWLNAAATSPTGPYPSPSPAESSGPVGLFAAPNQARAPKGTPIGGEWIDTPGGLLADLTPVTAGPIEAGSPEAAKALTDYDEYIDGLTSEEFRDTPIGASDVLYRAYKYTGYDQNQPTLVDEIPHGPNAMYRGTAPGWAYDESGAGHDVLAPDITEQFRTGEHWAGKGIHGDGSYFARNEYDPDKAWVIGNNYAGDTDGAILRAQWKPTANVLTFNSDYDRQEWDRLNIDASGGANAAMNTGVAATILGYDGIRIGQGGDAWYEVILNRAAVDVQRDDIPVNEDWF